MPIAVPHAYVLSDGSEGSALSSGSCTHQQQQRHLTYHPPSRPDPHHHHQASHVHIAHPYHYRAQITMPGSQSHHSGSESPQANKRKRSRAGCYTCRRRKKACDSVRPVCGSCTRLGIPCVFPKLYRNAKGELVPSPQPNGRTKRLPKDDVSASPEQSTTSAGGSQQQIPWETPGASSSSAPNAPVNWAQPSPSGQAGHAAGPRRSDGTMEGHDADLTDSALDAFLANLGDIESGQSWAWPLFGDALELDLGPSSDNMSSSTPHLPTPAQHSDSSAGPGNNSNANFMPNKMVTAAAVLEHLPALYDYWVNSFSHVLSVLGPGHNPVVNGMLPVVQRSPLVMCALIAWAATRRANTGHPYEDVARVATETTIMQMDQLDIERDLTDDEKEEYMWTFMIVGGLEIVKGDVTAWTARLPMIRRLLSKTLGATDFRKSQTWQALAYNCVYHDVLASITTTQPPDFPTELYCRILGVGMSDLEMDCYMGATRVIFSFLVEIAVLAGQVSQLLKQPMSVPRDARLGELLAQCEPLLARLRAVDTPIGLFSHPLPIGTDKSLLVVSFQTFQLSAELYLRSAVMRAAGSDLHCRLLAARILNYLRLILDTPNESQMMFPLFLAGLYISDERGRAEILGIFTKFSERVQCRNVFTVINLMLEIWKRDPEGDRYIDWRQVAEDMNAGISFA